MWATDICSHVAGVAVEEVLSPGHTDRAATQTSLAAQAPPSHREGKRPVCLSDLDERSRKSTHGPVPHPDTMACLGKALGAARLWPEDQCHCRAELAAVPWWFTAAYWVEAFSNKKETRKAVSSRRTAGSVCCQ